MALTNILDVIDRHEIGDLLVAYSWAIDGGDSEAFAELFLPDGEFRGADGSITRGHEELRAFATRVYGAQADRLQHIASNLTFSRVAGDRVTVHSYVQVLTASASGPRMLALGGYVDEVVKTAAGWRFAMRVFESWRPTDAATHE